MREVRKGDEGRLQDLPEPTSYDKRRQQARLFALVCLVLAGFWAAKVARKYISYEVQIEYNYRGIAHPDEVSKVRGKLYASGADKAHARITYFHYRPLPQRGARVYRRQKLKLPAGKYRLQTTIHYRGARKPRSLAQILEVKQGGIFYVRLWKAR